MTNKDFYELMQKTFDSATEIAKAKGADYTKGSEDALANFKEGGKALGIPPEKVCWVFMNKHYQAITNYIRTGGEFESEPIEERIKDMINYLVLLQGIILENNGLLVTPIDEYKMETPIDEYKMEYYKEDTIIDKPIKSEF